MSAKASDYHKRLSDFMTEFVFPAEAEYDNYRHEAGPNDHTVPPVIEELKTKAKERGLWNLFLPAESGLTNLEYAPLAELTGWSLELAPEAVNCAAPDTGNMETLHLFATEEQRKQWLEPLLAGEIRSAFSMTEPAVASSDARNIQTAIVRDGSDYVINGRKWWTSGAADPRCKILIVMGRTNPEAASHQQQSMVLVPIDTPGVSVLRSTSVFGWQDQHGHCEIVYDNVRVPATNLLGEEGGGFAIAQARLGPGRIHHCMRALGGVDGPAEQLDALAHAAQAASLGRWRGHHRRGKQIGDGQPRRDRRNIQHHTGFRLRRVLGDVGQRLLGDAVQREADRGRHVVGGALDAQPDGQAGPLEALDEGCDVVDSGFGRGRRGLGGPVVEQPDGTPDVGHRLAAQPFGLLERLDRVIDVAVLLQRAPGAGHVQQGDAQRMGDDVVHLAGDAPPFVGGGVFGQHLLRRDLLGQQQPLGAHQVTEQPAHRDKAQVQHHRVEPVQRGRGEHQRRSRRRRKQAAQHRGQCRDDQDHQDE